MASIHRPRVFVIGATNRPELLDEALLRPGRLGERIDIPLPDAAGRKAMLAQFTQKMQLAPSVNLEHLAAQSERASGALLKGLCTLAGRNALVRELDARGIAPAVTEVAPVVPQEDFHKALRELLSTPRRAVSRLSPAVRDAIRNVIRAAFHGSPAAIRLIFATGILIPTLTRAQRGSSVHESFTRRHRGRCDSLAASPRIPGTYRVCRTVKLRRTLV